MVLPFFFTANKINFTAAMQKQSCTLLVVEEKLKISHKNLLKLKHKVTFNKTNKNISFGPSLSFFFLYKNIINKNNHFNH